MVMEQADIIRIQVELGTAFSPSAPINKKELFAGRADQVERIIEAVSQRGRHVVLFGERGIGKTSLASVTHDFLIDALKENDTFMSVRINCDSTDSFDSLWAKVSSEIGVTFEKRKLQLPESNIFMELHHSLTHGGGTPNSVRQYLELIGKECIIIIDEFDRIVKKSDVARAMADTIKALSDHVTNSSIILVGVANTIDELLVEHASVDRALEQILLPRMSLDELKQIITKGLSQVGMAISEEAKEQIAFLSQGLPHYTHLLAYNSASDAIVQKHKKVEISNLYAALQKSTDQAEETIRSAYHLATVSPQKSNLLKQVLLACSLAKNDELGYFTPSDVSSPMSKIMKKPYKIPSFIHHLNTLCLPIRGNVLQSVGSARNKRFRFSNPQLRPFIIMRGISDRLITAEELQSF